MVLVSASLPMLVVSAAGKGLEKVGQGDRVSSSRMNLPVDPLGPLAVLSWAAVRRFVRVTQGTVGKGSVRSGRVAAARRDLRMRLETLGGAIDGSARPAPPRVRAQRRDWQALARQAQAAVVAELKLHSLWWGLGAVAGVVVVIAV